MGGGKLHRDLNQCGLDEQVSKCCQWNEQIAYVRVQVSIRNSFATLSSLPYTHCYLQILCKHENKSRRQKIMH